MVGPVVGLPDCNSAVGGLNGALDLLGLPGVPEDTVPAIDPGLNTDDFIDLPMLGRRLERPARAASHRKQSRRIGSRCLRKSLSPER